MDGNTCHLVSGTQMISGLFMLHLEDEREDGQLEHTMVYERTLDSQTDGKRAKLVRNNSTR